MEDPRCVNQRFQKMSKKNYSPVIGVLGGGQLARMLADAAAPLGLSVRVLAPSNAALIPKAFSAAEIAPWTPENLVHFSQQADVIALENEFVDADALDALERANTALLLPSARAIRVIQDKLTQKQTLQRAGLPLPEFCAVDSPSGLVEAGNQWGWPVVLKKRRNGYDGKGNATIRNSEQAPAAYAALGHDGQDLYVERYCPFVRELAVMVVRSRTGETRTYPVVETRQKDHICHEVLAPAPDLPPGLAAKIQDMAIRAVEAFDLVGSVGIELFLLADGSVAINEMAPRVHNSGHYTIEACPCSQFENHLRALLGWPLGDTSLITPAAVMVNLLGSSEGPGWPTGVEQALATPGAHLHIYGKAESKPGRKMGHLTLCGEALDTTLQLAREAAAHLRFGG